MRPEPVRRQAMNEARVRAPALPADPNVWLNTDGKALSLKELRGSVVLLHFWTHGCINCQHVLPDLHWLEAKYAGQPFVVIGIHAGKFDGEKTRAGVESAVARLGITHPVVLDSDQRTWREYSVHAWPTLALIDPEGYLVGSVSGEGHRDLLDQTIAELFAAKGQTAPARPRAVRPASPSPSLKTPFRFPGKVFADSAWGRLFVADTGRRRLVVCDLDGGNPVTVGSGLAGGEDGDFAECRFHAPQGMTRIGDALYVCDSGDHTLRRVDFSTGTVTRVAGTGGQGAPRQAQGAALHTPLSSPWDVCHASDALYIALAGTHQIARYDLRTAQLTAWAGSGREARIDGPLSHAAFAQPSGLAAATHALLVADSESSSIRQIVLDAAEPQVITLTGGELFDWGDQDGQGRAGRLQHPLGVAVGGGRVYIADTYNHRIKMLDPHSGELTTLCGDGQPGMENGPGPLARFNEPGGLFLSGSRLYIADTNNHAVRVYDLESEQVSTLDFAGLSAPGATE